jgi:hypothetical protein
VEIGGSGWNWKRRAGTSREGTGRRARRGGDGMVEGGERGGEKEVRELARTNGKGPKQGKEERGKQRRRTPAGVGEDCLCLPEPEGKRESGTDSSKRLQKEDPPCWSWRRLYYCCCAPLRPFRPRKKQPPRLSITTKKDNPVVEHHTYYTQALTENQSTPLLVTAEAVPFYSLGPGVRGGGR